MTSLKVQETIQKQSKRCVNELEKCESDFDKAMISFLTSNSKNCLLVETNDSKLGAIRIMHLLKQLKESQENEKPLRRYLGAENQTFLNWKQLLDIAGTTDELPTFTNLLVCMFPDRESTKIGNIEEEIFRKINDRLNIAVLKKIIFITSCKGDLDEYLKKNDTKTFLKIDEFGNKMTSVLGDGKPALLDKASCGDVNEVEELFKNGIDVNATSGEHQVTALHVAAEKGLKNVVLTLLRNGADMLPNKSSGDTPLHTAAEHGHTDIVSTFLENGVHVDIMGGRKETALIRAVSKGHGGVVKTLLKYNANVNAKNMYDSTALRLAMEYKHNEIVSILLENGANIDITDSKSGCTILHIAAYRSDNDIVKTFLERGIPVDAQQCKGKTALHLAALSGKIEVTNTLLNYGADINAKDEDGYTPLIYAAFHGKFEIVKVLVEKGANVHDKDRDGKTALDKALEKGHDKVVSLLKTI